MFLPQIIAWTAPLLTSVSATTLFVSSYAGDITTLSLTASSGTYDLQKSSYSSECGPNPSWLTLDPSHGTLYCLDEGLEVVNGSLNSFTVNLDGSLNLVQREQTISGPVSGVIYGNPAVQRGIALAHYTGSAVSSWLLNSSAPGHFMLNQNLPQPLNETGPNTARQEAPHEHEAIVDPTGQYVLVPDLGSDLVRVFSIDLQTLELSAGTPLKMPAGSGPRHAVFYQPYGVACENCTSFLFVVTELGNIVTSFAVTYPAAGGMGFEQVWSSSVYGELNLPEGNAPAEIAISPDNRFLVISNRNNTSFSTTIANGSAIASDSLSTFGLNDDGTAEFLQLASAGGSYPRHFSMNKYGNLVAVGLQHSAEVVILGRNVQTGLIGRELARVDVVGNITAVMWWDLYA